LAAPVVLARELVASALVSIDGGVAGGGRVVAGGAE
jgi:Glyoxalase-like domain